MHRVGLKVLYLVASTRDSLALLHLLPSPLSSSPALTLCGFPSSSSSAAIATKSKISPVRSRNTSGIVGMATEVRGHEEATGHDGELSSKSSSSSRSWRSLLEVSVAKSRRDRGSNYVQLATTDPGTGEPRVRTVVFRGFLSGLPLDHPLSNLCLPHHEGDGKNDDAVHLPCVMKMCTDSRSQKAMAMRATTMASSNANAAEQPAELVWWFPKTSEQYRIRGRLVLVGDQRRDGNEDGNGTDRALEIARKELWGNLSDPARESFLGLSVPGAPYGGSSAESNNDTSSTNISNSNKIQKTVPPGGRDDGGKVLPPPETFLLMLLDPHEVDYLRLTGSQYRQIDKRADGTWSWQRVNP